jgi:hypothetical protein
MTRRTILKARYRQGAARIHPSRLAGIAYRRTAIGIKAHFWPTAWTARSWASRRIKAAPLISRTDLASPARVDSGKMNPIAKVPFDIPQCCRSPAIVKHRTVQRPVRATIPRLTEPVDSCPIASGSSLIDYWHQRIALDSLWARLQGKAGQPLIAQSNKYLTEECLFMEISYGPAYGERIHR